MSYNKKDLQVFFKEVIKEPENIAAIFPSSSNLSSLMVSALPPPKDNLKVVEIGPGIGSITASLLNYGILKNNLILIEKNKNLANLVKKKYPFLPVMITDAYHINRVLKDLNFPPQVNAVISSLGFLNMSYSQARNLLIQIDKAIIQGGYFIQYTYGPNPPIPDILRQELNWSVEKVGRTWKNVPPASVYRYVKLNK